MELVVHDGTELLDDVLDDIVHSDAVAVLLEVLREAPRVDDDHAITVGDRVCGRSLAGVDDGARPVVLTAAEAIGTTSERKLVGGHQLLAGVHDVELVVVVGLAGVGAVADSRRVRHAEASIDVITDELLAHQSRQVSDDIADVCHGVRVGLVGTGRVIRLLDGRRRRRRGVAGLARSAVGRAGGLAVAVVAGRGVVGATR